MKDFKKPGILLLEDGTIYHGHSIGVEGKATGELCFNTGMTGYQEVFTDPSYYGQLMITTNAHIGNYGVHKNEIESDDMKIAGLICKNFNLNFSRAAANESLREYFIRQEKVVLSDIDTRSVVRHIRDKGAMNAIISSSEMDINVLKDELSNVPSMEGLELSSFVTTEQPYFCGDENAKYKIAVLDLGVKKNILRCLVDRDCYLKVFPMSTSYNTMCEWNPDGFFLSNGPGDPSSLHSVIEETKKIINDGRAVFGICLGHQIIALSENISTYKMHNGHRGINHPVINLSTRKAEVTSQNHGFSVSRKDIDNNPDIEITHLNLNDSTVEGIKLNNKNCFSVQFHPESSPGPHDSQYLFDQFINNIKK